MGQVEVGHQQVSWECCAYLQDWRFFPQIQEGCSKPFLSPTLSLEAVLGIIMRRMSSSRGFMMSCSR